MQLAYDLTGLEKASVLLMSLGPRASEEVLKHLTPAERQILDGQIVKLRHVKSITRRLVLDEVSEIIRARAPYAPSAGPSDPDAGLPLKWLETVPAWDIAEMLSRERPANIALVLAHFSPPAAADVLSQLDEKARNQVVHRLATMGPASPEAISAVDGLMRERVRKRSALNTAALVGTPDAVPSPTVSAAAEQRTFLGHLRQADAPPEPLSSPEDMIALTDCEIRSVLREVDPQDLCTSLRVASDELRSAVTRNVNEPTRKLIIDALESPSQATVRDIESAAARVVEAMRTVLNADVPSLRSGR